jgi:hypothetical protein
MPTLQHILEVLKLAPRYLAAIGLFCGFLLLVPASIANGLGVHDFTQSYRTWLGIALIATLSLLAVNGCVTVCDVIRNRMRRATAYQRKLTRLHGLTEEEKQILRYYIAKQSKTNVLRIDDGIVNGLRADGIIHLAARQGDIVEGFAHNIDEAAWEYLNEHEELLEGSTNTYRTDKRERDQW